MRATHEIDTRLKTAKTRLIFVEKLANSLAISWIFRLNQAGFNSFFLRALLVQSSLKKIVT